LGLKDVCLEVFVALYKPEQANHFWLKKVSEIAD